MATQQVEVVAVDHAVWTGEAEAVNARTLEGEVGILARHAPMLGVLAPGHIVRVVEEGSRVDGAAGWCTAIGGEYGVMSGLLPAEAAREIYGRDPHVRTAGALRRCIPNSSERTGSGARRPAI